MRLTLRYQEGYGGGRSTIPIILCGMVWVESLGVKWYTKTMITNVSIQNRGYQLFNPTSMAATSGAPGRCCDGVNRRRRAIPPCCCARGGANVSPHIHLVVRRCRHRPTRVSGVCANDTVEYWSYSSTQNEKTLSTSGSI